MTLDIYTPLLGEWESYYDGRLGYSACEAAHEQDLRCSTSHSCSLVHLFLTSISINY